MLVVAVVNQIANTLTDKGHEIAGITSVRLLSADMPNGILPGPARRNTRLAKARRLTPHKRAPCPLVSAPFPPPTIECDLIVYLLILLAHFCAHPMAPHQLHLVMPGKISYKRPLSPRERSRHGRLTAAFLPVDGSPGLAGSAWP